MTELAMGLAPTGPPNDRWRNVAYYGKHARDPLSALSYTLGKIFVPGRDYTGKHRSELPYDMKIKVCQIKDGSLAGLWCYSVYVGSDIDHWHYDSEHLWKLFGHVKQTLYNWWVWRDVWAKRLGAGPELCDLIRENKLQYNFGQAYKDMYGSNSYGRTFAKEEEWI